MEKGFTLQSFNMMWNTESREATGTLETLNSEAAELDLAMLRSI